MALQDLAPPLHVGVGHDDVAVEAARPDQRLSEVAGGEGRSVRGGGEEGEGSSAQPHTPAQPPSVHTCPPHRPPKPPLYTLNGPTLPSYLVQHLREIGSSDNDDSFRGPEAIQLDQKLNRGGGGRGGGNQEEGRDIND